MLNEQTLVRETGSERKRGREKEREGGRRERGKEHNGETIQLKIFPVTMTMYTNAKPTSHREVLIHVAN